MPFQVIFNRRNNNSNPSNESFEFSTHRHNIRKFISQEQVIRTLIIQALNFQQKGTLKIFPAYIRSSSGKVLFFKRHWLVVNDFFGKRERAFRTVSICVVCTFPALLSTLSSFPLSSAGMMSSTLKYFLLLFFTFFVLLISPASLGNNSSSNLK